jgi:1-deoxy-D-xylulose-5-phosphate reductoisomerase
MVNDMKIISVLGSTGSIGRSSLSVISSLGSSYKILGLSCHKNITLLKNQIDQFNPLYAIITDQKSYDLFVKEHGKDLGDTKILFGDEGLDIITSDENVDTVIAAITGFPCIYPVISAINHNKTILIANKEILVSAGDMIISQLRNSKAIMLPIDSEHNALLQIILSSGLEYKINDADYYKAKIKNIIITASGGPFIDYNLNDLKRVSAKDAIQHPTWDMGKKISVDSSTMMNKGLEIIEAKTLFNLSINNISAIIHRQSKIHAFVEFFDGTIISHMSNPDMKIPISYAITYPERVYRGNRSDFSYDNFSFEELIYDNFPCYRLAREVAEIGKNTGLILNAANEISVEYFLEDRISYLDIPNIIEDILESSTVVNHDTLDSIIDNDREIRELTRDCIKTKYS